MTQNPNIEFAIVGNEKQNEINIYTGGRNEHIVAGHKAGPFMLDFYAIEYCTRGGQTLLIDDVPYKIHEGDLYIVPPHVKLENHYTANVTSISYIGVKGFMLKRYFKALGFSAGNIVFPHKLSKFCVDCLEKVIDSLEIRESLTVCDLDSAIEVELIPNDGYSNNLSFEAQLKQQGYFSLFLSELMSILGKNAKHTPESSIQQTYINSAIHYIETNYHHNINIDGVAKFIGVSRSYLFRLFREEFGISPQEYLIEMRMKAACDLLRLPDVQIKTVAASVGYDPINFSRIFKKTIGVTPLEYHNKHSKSGR